MNTGPIGYGTGALPEWDSKSLDYPVAALLDTGAAPVSKKWNLVQRFDQGQTPRCVGFALAQELSSEPVVIACSDYTGPNIYNLAQKLDEWPGEQYDGTSLLGGLKALKQWGYVGEYRWGASLDDVLLSLSQLGPVTMAGPWLTGMFSTNAQGQIVVSGISGNIGHCYMLGEVDVANKRCYVEMTWGPNFSPLGWRAWFSWDDIAKLLSMGTQAAIITQRFDPSIPTPPTPKTHGDITLIESTGKQRTFTEV